MEENDEKKFRPTSRVSSTRMRDRSSITSSQSGRDSAPLNKPYTGMIAAASRPVTQQGMSGVRPLPPSSGLNRQYHDKRYYMSTIQNHMLLINDEINVLKKKLYDNKLDATNYDKCKRQVEDYTKQLSDYEETLTVYNIAIETSMFKGSRSNIDNDSEKIRRSNQQLMAQLESIFSEKITCEEQLTKLQQQIAMETQISNDILATLPDDKQQEYQNLWQENEHYKSQEELIKSEIKDLRKTTRSHEQHVILNEMKRTRYNLLLKLHELNLKRDKLQQESKIKRTPSQEREYLLEQVKQDRAATELFKIQQNEVKTELEKVNDRLTELEDELSEKNSARLNKYKELLKREETMEAFLRNYDETYEEQVKKIVDLRSKIVFSLEYISDNSLDLNFQSVNTINTLDSSAPKEELEQEYGKLKFYLATLNSINKRLQSETETLKQQNVVYENEMETFKNVDQARDELIERQNVLEAQEESLEGVLQATRSAVIEADKERKEMETQLKFNDSYSTLNNLEETYNQLVCENDRLRKSIEDIKMMDNFEKIRSDALQMVDEILKETQKRLS